jgi:proline iminopeptidase
MFTVVRFDQRGCGRSTGTDPFAIEQAVNDLDQIRACLGFDQWTVAGHSWGADLAICYAARHPDRVMPASDRTRDEEREWCLLLWRPDFSSTSGAAEHALSLWDTRPPGAAVNETANRELWAERATKDLHQVADRVSCPVTMLFGADDPRPWTASDSLLAALPDGRRIVLNGTGHAPWVERSADTRHLIIDALRPAGRDS